MASTFFSEWVEGLGTLFRFPVGKAEGSQWNQDTWRSALPVEDAVPMFNGQGARMTLEQDDILFGIRPCASCRSSVGQTRRLPSAEGPMSNGYHMPNKTRLHRSRCPYLTLSNESARIILFPKIWTKCTGEGMPTYARLSARLVMGY